MPSHKAFVARQAIFDERMNVIGYEILHRSGPVNEFRHPDPDRASLELIEATHNSHRIDLLVGNGLAFVNATREVLLSDHVLVLDPARTVLEVLETVRPDDEVFAACRALRERGYVLALDDFCPGSRLEPLVAVADIIKVDFLEVRGDERKRLFERLSHRGRQLLAEKVETYDDVHDAKQIGYSLYQGFFFCRPELLVHREIPRFKANYVRFLTEISRTEIDLERVEIAVKAELSISVKLLRYLNSSNFGLRNEIASIRQALIHLGTVPLRRWGSLVAITGLGEDKPDELVHATMLRAYFCEFLVAGTGLQADAAEAFLVGIYSTLDALLDRALAEALDEVRVHKKIRDALMGDDSELGRIFRLVIVYERGDWPRARVLANGLGLSEQRVSEAYLRAMAAADEVFRIGASKAA